MGNKRWRFLAWVLGGLLLPLLLTATLAGIFRSADGLATALTILGTLCETAGLVFAGIQLHGVAKHWGVEGFWQRFGRSRDVTVQLTGSSLLITTASGTLVPVFSSADRSVEDRLDTVERSITALHESLGAAAAEQRRQLDEAKKAVAEVREAGRAAVAGLAEQLKELAVADFNPAFGFLALTTMGMIVANLAEPISHLLACEWLVP